GEVVHKDDLLLTREVDETLEVGALDGCSRRVVRERRDENARPGLRRLPRILERTDEVERGNPADGRAGEAGGEEMDRVARTRDERRIAGTQQHPEQMHEPLLCAERERCIRLRVELDAVAVAVQLADGSAQVRKPAARRV